MGQMCNETAEYKAIRDKIDEILLKFNFDKVANIMDQLIWKWYDNTGHGKVPRVDDLRKKAYELLIKSVETEESVASGGLKVICGKPLVEWDRDNCKFSVDLSLEFVLESSNK